MVAAGIPVIQHPPRRSQHALVTHWAPPLSTNDKALPRMRMCQSDSWKKAHRDPHKLTPAHESPLASFSNALLPKPTHRFEKWQNASIIASDTVDGQPNHCLNPWITLIKIEGNNIQVKVHTQRKLSQVVRTNREAIKQFGKCIDLYYIVGISHMT